MPLKNCSTYNSWNRYYFLCIVSSIYRQRYKFTHSCTINGHLDRQMCERGRYRLLRRGLFSYAPACCITIKNLHGVLRRKNSQAMCKLIFSSVHMIYSCDNTWRNGDFARLISKYQFYVMKNDNFDWLKWQKFCFSKKQIFLI